MLKKRLKVIHFSGCVDIVRLCFGSNYLMHKRLEKRMFDPKASLGPHTQICASKTTGRLEREELSKLLGAVEAPYSGNSAMECPALPATHSHTEQN
jgi:hypothetical protein